MERVVIWHNPRCAKSRETLSLLEQKGFEVEVFDYLNRPVSATSIRRLLEKLGIAPIELIRIKEELYRVNFAHLNLTDSELIDVMVQNPKLIERPVVVLKEKAAIGRPPENVLKLFEDQDMN